MKCQGCQAPVATKHQFGALEVMLCSVCLKKPRGQAPYGYRRVVGGFQYDAEEQRIRERIVRLSVHDLSARGIAAQLNHDQVPSRGAQWYPNTVARIIQDARKASPRDLLRQLGACQEALSWLDQQEGDIEKAWEQCVRADWLIWLIYVVDGWQVVAELALGAVPEICPLTRQSLAQAGDTWNYSEPEHPALTGLHFLGYPAPTKELCDVFVWLDAIMSYPALIELTREQNIPVTRLCKGALAKQIRQRYPSPPRFL